MIDDERAIRNTLRDIVAWLGYATDTAANGPEGLELFERNPYDVVLTDVLMPGMTGWEVLQELRRLAPTVPVVIVTGDSVSADDHRALQPAVALVRKPVNVKALKATLSRLLDGVA